MNTAIRHHDECGAPVIDASWELLGDADKAKKRTDNLVGLELAGTRLRRAEMEHEAAQTDFNLKLARLFP